MRKHVEVPKRREMREQRQASGILRESQKGASCEVIAAWERWAAQTRGLAKRSEARWGAGFWRLARLGYPHRGSPLARWSVVSLGAVVTRGALRSTGASILHLCRCTLSLLSASLVSVPRVPCFCLDSQHKASSTQRTAEPYGWELRFRYTLHHRKASTPDVTACSSCRPGLCAAATHLQ